MIEEIMNYIHNYFDVRRVKGSFIISSGLLDCDFLQEGQYFRIIGSVFNDGVWIYPDADLTDEEFTGEVWALAVPPMLSQIVDEITEWQEKNAEAINSPYQSESFGGYSYSKGSSADGKALTWRDVFGARLNHWRKLA